MAKQVGRDNDVLPPPWMPEALGEPDPAAMRQMGTT
jgi:hypothetical protein